MNSKKPRSLQENIRSRQRETFVGRKEQLAFFSNNLGWELDDPQRRFVINVSGQGGVGKTLLLQQFHELAEKHGAITAHTDETLEDVPGVKAHRPPKDSGSTMGGWYAARGLYRPEELGGLPVEKFCQAVTAEGFQTSPGINEPLHLHPALHDADIYGHGKPTVIVNASRDVRQGPGSLPVTENIHKRALSVPWFKHDRPEVIEEYAAAFRKVAENADELMKK